MELETWVHISTPLGLRGTDPSGLLEVLGGDLQHTLSTLLEFFKASAQITP